MMLLTKALLVFRMFTAASVAPVAPVAYDACSEDSQCGSGLICEEGLCTPDFFCVADTECPEAPEGYSRVCDVGPTCTGEEGACRLAPGAHDECPEGTTHEVGVSGVDICVGI